jgi:hypothetical protein
MDGLVTGVVQTDHRGRALLTSTSGNGVAQPQDRHASNAHADRLSLIDRLPHINNATAARLIF